LILREGCHSHIVYNLNKPSAMLNILCHCATLRTDLAIIVHLLEQEERGNYPGGVARSRERHEILTLHVRPVALAALKNRSPHEAGQLYRKTLAWHVWQGRWKFLVGFPLLAAISVLRNSRQT